MATETIPRSDPQQRRANPGTQLAFSIVAAVIGATVPELVGAATPAARLGGMLAAAVLPLLITWVGPWQPLRAGVGAAVAIAAIGLTYLGGTAVDRQAFPASEQIADAVAPPEAEPPGPGPGPGPGPDTGRGVVDVNPAEVTCAPEVGCDEVTVTNAGNAPLEELAVAVEGDGFDVTTTCAPPLPAGERCTITPVLLDAAAGEGRVLITHDGDGSPAEVALAAAAPATAVELAFDGDPPCELTAEGQLRVPFDIEVTGEAARDVTVTATLSDGSQAGGLFASGVGSTAQALVLPEGQALSASGPAEIALTHDSSDQRLTLAVVLPEPGAPPQPLDCVVTS